MSRKQEFDPNAIPNYGGAGRVGELDPNEPEEQQSSTQIAGTDPDVQTDPAAGAEPADDVAAPDGGDARVARAATAPRRTARETRQPGSPIPPMERPRTMRDDRARGETHQHTDNPEPLHGGAGGIDGLVGAP